MKNYSSLLIDRNRTILDALKQLDEISPIALTLFVIDDDYRVLGSITDGDVRRTLVRGSKLDDSIISVYNKNFYFLYENDKNLYLEISGLKKKGIKLIPVLSKNGQIVEIIDIRAKKSILPLDVVLMAGGRGERLRPLTDTVPKPLLKIGDKPIIEHNIDRLIEYGISNFFITENYLAEQLVEYFGNGSAKGINIHHILEPEKMGTFGSVSLIDGFVNDYVLVMNSDLFTNINYEDLFLHFMENDADLSAVAVSHTISIPYGIFDLEGHSIRGIQEKPILNYYANAGIYLFKKNFMDIIPKNTFFDATDFISALIDKECKVIRFPLTGYWIDIGKHEEYNKAQELIRHTKNEN